MKRRRLLILLFLLLAAMIPLLPNAVVCLSTYAQIGTPAESDAPVTALVLGAKAYEDRLSDMLRDRMDTAIDLYRSGDVDRLLLSGDGSCVPSETAAMRAYALAAGVPEDAIFVDESGFCTFDSVKRAKEVYRLDRVLLVTQRYHLYRALYIANDAGLSAYGVDAERGYYRGQVFREVRECAARCKDFFLCLFS